MADVDPTIAQVVVQVEGEEALKNLALVGAEAFAHIASAAATGNFTGAITFAFGEMAGAINEAAQRVVSFVEEQAKLIETLSNLATATGTTIPEILGLREAFASVGISTQGFERAFSRLAITIGQEWASIQQSVRTSADEQSSAMNHVQQSSLNVAKAYRNLHNVIADESVTAQKDAEGILGAAISLARAEKALSESAQDSQKNSNSLAGAQLSLARAQNNLAKDTGQALPYDEKQLKVQEDQLAVSEARQRVQDAINKKKAEGLERESKELAVEKAKTELEAARNKQIADQAAGIDKIRQAQLDIKKAIVERSEAEEKAHQVELKNIPAIAKEVEQVVSGYKNWDGVMNHAEISATNLSKAVILAAAGNSNEPPKAMEVFKEMSKLFEHMGDSSDAMNKKMEIVQKTMGAGFRSGQASAAQLLAVLEKGPEALEKFGAQMNTFAKSLGMDELGKSTERLKEFNSQSAQLGTTLDIVKARFASILSVPLAQFFERMRESIVSPEGSLNHLIQAFGKFLDMMADIASTSNVWEFIGEALSHVADIAAGMLNAISAIGDAFKGVATQIAALTGLKPETVMTAMGAAAALASGAFRAMAVSIATFMARLILISGTIGLVVTALGNLYAVYLKLTGAAKTMEEAHKNALETSGRQILDTVSGGASRGTALGLSDEEAKKLGLAAEKTSKAADKTDDAANKSKDAASKSDGAAEKASGASDKHASASDKQSASADKLDTAATSISNNSGFAAEKLTTAAERLMTAAEALRQAATPKGGAATGGRISGPGGPRDDKAGLYALSDGEYVVQTAAVNHYGPQLFDALNSLAVGGFAVGGSVGGARAPSITSGPAAGPSAVLNLTIDGQHFNGLQAPEHVATKLKTYAVGRQSSSAGRMPTWMR